MILEKTALCYIKHNLFWNDFHAIVTSDVLFSFYECNILISIRRLDYKGSHSLTHNSGLYPHAHVCFDMIDYLQIQTQWIGHFK